MKGKSPNNPKLVVFSGLPGVGKTSLAKRLAKTASGVYLRIDTIEQAIKQSSLKGLPSDDAGYEIAYHIARDNLLLDNDVVADSVNPIPITRSAWAKVAEQSYASYIPVEVVCSDAEEHRRRVENRRADIEHHKLPTWEDVQNRAYDPWSTDRLLIDTSNKSKDSAYSELLELLTSFAGEFTNGRGTLKSAD